MAEIQRHSEVVTAAAKIERQRIEDELKTRLDTLVEDDTVVT
jgi:hypothetical protein